jgi:Uma2 family endonuclease
MAGTATFTGKPPQVQPHRWTRYEFEKMAEIGLFSAEARLELVEGEIWEMAAHTSLHAAAIALLQRRLDRMLDAGHHLRIQLPLALTDDSEPEPDIAVVSGNPEDYWNKHPDSAVMVIEVAYSSLDHDQERKRRLYASCRIPEYWILNLNERQLEVYREPQQNDYQVCLILTAGAAVSPLLHPDGTIEVASLLPRG